MKNKSRAGDLLCAIVIGAVATGVVVDIFVTKGKDNRIKIQEYAIKKMSRKIEEQQLDIDLFVERIQKDYIKLNAYETTMEFSEEEKTKPFAINEVMRRW